MMCSLGGIDVNKVHNLSAWLTYARVSSARQILRALDGQLLGWASIDSAGSMASDWHFQRVLRRKCE